MYLVRLKLILLILAVLILTACNKVPAGNVGIKFYLLGGDKGVDTEELGPGRYWIGINEELYLFPTFQQNKVWTNNIAEDSLKKEGFTFQTQEGMTVGADVGIAYRVDASKVNELFIRYRKGIDEITNVHIRNVVRDEFNQIAAKYPVERVYGEGKAQLLDEVEVAVRREVSNLGIILESLYWVGSLRLPEAVNTALNKKIEATQKAEQRERELRGAEAEAAKIIATARGEAESLLLKAKAEAEANTLVSRSITPELVRWSQIKRWDGALPQVTGGATPFITIK